MWTPLWESYANQSPDPEVTVEEAKKAIVSSLFYHHCYISVKLLARIISVGNVKFSQVQYAMIFYYL